MIEHIEELETLSRRQLDLLIDRRIRATVTLAYGHTKYWREKFDSLGIKPSDLGDRADLLEAYKKGLSVTREDLVNRPNDMLPDYSRDTFIEQLWSSGTSGMPKVAYHSADDLKRWTEQGLHGLNALKLKPGDRFLSLLAPQPFSSGVMMREPAEKYGLMYLQATPVPTIFLAETIKRYRPDALTSLPTRMFILPLELRELGVDPKSLNIRSVGMGGEAVTAERRHKIREEWGAEVLTEVYATNECGVISFNCDRYCGMHVIESRSFITFVDPETRDEIHGERNGIDLITNLYDVDERPCDFMINYSHGDIGRVLSLDKCECGRTFKRITHPFREDDIVSLRGVKLYVRDVESFLNTLPSYFTGEYLAVFGEDKTQRVPFLEVRLEMKDRIPEDVATHLHHGVCMSLFRSNPAALSVMHREDIRVVTSDKGRLFDRLSVRPGKPQRLIRLQ